jgi:hypothetical protein
MRKHKLLLFMYSDFGPIWVQTRAQSGEWYGSGTLHLRQILRGSLPWLTPKVRLSKFRHQVPPRPPRRQRSQGRKVKLWARMLSGNFAEMTTSTSFRDLLHAANLRHGTDFPSERRRVEGFSPLKIRRFRPGLNPRTCELKASKLPLGHRSCLNANIFSLISLT